MHVNRDAEYTADSPIGQRHTFTVTVREFDRQRQAAEKVALLTRPAQARRDAPYPMRRSRIVQILNVPQRENKLSWQLGAGG